MLGWLIGLSVAVAALAFVCFGLVCSAANHSMIQEILWARMRKYDGDPIEMYPLTGHLKREEKP